MGRLSHRTLLFAVQFLVSVLFVVLTIRRVDLGAVWHGVARVSLTILALSLVSKLLGFGFMTLRSVVLARHLGNVSPRILFKSLFVSFIGNNLLPFRIGEALRAFYLTGQTSLDVSAAFALVFTERVLDTLALGLLVVFCSPILWRLGSPLGGLALFVVTVVVFIAGVLLVARRPSVLLLPVDWGTRPLPPKAREWVRLRAGRFTDALAAVHSPSTLAAAVGCTLGFWLSAAASIRIWLWAFGLGLPWSASPAILLYVSVASLLPAMPGFVGTYHFFLQRSLMLFGVAKDAATAVAFVGHATATLPFTIIGIPFVIRDVLTLVARARRPLASLPATR
jgi:uncharacterized protein (TIRG00374 family)